VHAQRKSWLRVWEKCPHPTLGWGPRMVNPAGRTSHQQPPPGRWEHDTVPATKPLVTYQWWTRCRDCTVFCDWLQPRSAPGAYSKTQIYLYGGWCLRSRELVSIRNCCCGIFTSGRYCSNIIITLCIEHSRGSHVSSRTKYQSSVDPFPKFCIYREIHHFNAIFLPELPFRRRRFEWQEFTWNLK